MRRASKPRLVQSACLRGRRLRVHHDECYLIPSTQLLTPCFLSTFEPLQLWIRGRLLAFVPLTFRNASGVPFPLVSRFQAPRSEASSFCVCAIGASQVYHRELNGLTLNAPCAVLGIFVFFLFDSLIECCLYT